MLLNATYVTTPKVNDCTINITDICFKCTESKVTLLHCVRLYRRIIIFCDELRKTHAEII